MPKFISDKEMTKLESQQTKQPRFISDEDMQRIEQPSSKEVSKLESAARGAIQGATFNLADEIAGAGSAAFRTIFGPAKLSDIKTTYEQERDISRESFKQAQKQNPMSYMGGEIAGNIGSMAIPGLGIAKTASTAAKIGKAAGLGAASALGSSEADLASSEMAKDVATGAALGLGIQGAAAVLPKVIPGTSKALQSVNNLFKKGVEKVGAGKEAAEVIPDYINVKEIANKVKNIKQDIAKAPNIKLKQINFIEGDNISPTEYTYEILKDGKPIGRTMVWRNDPKSIYEEGKRSASLKDIRLDKEYQKKGIGGEVLNQLNAKFGNLTSDTRGNISDLGSKFNSKYGNVKLDHSTNKPYFVFKDTNNIDELAKQLKTIKDKQSAVKKLTEQEKKGLVDPLMTGVLIDYAASAAGIPPGAFGSAAAAGKYILNNPKKYIDTVQKINSSSLPEKTKELLIRTLPTLMVNKKE